MLSVNVGKLWQLLALCLIITALQATVISEQIGIKKFAQRDSNDDPKEDAKINSSKSIPDACKRSYSLENQSQLKQLASQCHTIEGSLNFDNFVDPIVDLDKIETIKGDLTMENSAAIVRIDCPKLKTITGEFRIQALTSLTSLHLKELTEVDTIYWRVVPILSSVEFTKGLTKIKKITISDTSLIGFEGFGKDSVEELAVFNINNNRFMEFIDCGVKSVSETLSIQSNAREIQVSLENLIWANNMTIKDSSLLLIPNLQVVNNSLELIDNHFQSVECPKLQSIGGTLSFDSNKELSKVDMNNVSDIFGGIMITDNSKLDSIDFLQSLQQIGGAIQFSGNINKISFPKLKLVKGSVNINSSSDQLDCSSWTSPPSGISIIRGGKILCSSSKKQTKISLSEKGEILNTDTTNLEPTMKSTDPVSKNLSNRLEQSWKTHISVSVLSFVLSYMFTQKLQN